MKKRTLFSAFALLGLMVLLGCEKNEVYNPPPITLEPISHDYVLDPPDTITLADGRKAVVQQRVVYDTIPLSGPEVPARPFVLIASSSGTTYMWPEFMTVFKDLNPIQKGVGGHEWGHFRKRIRTDAVPYKPRQVVIMGGENNWYNVVSRGIKFGPLDYEYLVKTTIDSVKKLLPGVHLTIVECKTTPYLKSVHAQIREGNNRAEALLKVRYPNSSFVRINDILVDSDYRTTEINRMHLVPAANKKLESRIRPAIIK